MSRRDRGTVRYHRQAATATAWEVKSDLPGRLRLRNPILFRKSALCHAIERELTGVHGIDRFSTNSMTATVLVHYHAKQVTRSQVIEILGAARAGERQNPATLDEPDMHLPICTASLPLAAAAQFMAPPLLPAAAILYAYTSVPTSKEARRVFVDENRIGVDALDAVVMIGCLGSATPSWTRSRVGCPRRGCRSSWAIRSSGGSRPWARRTQRLPARRPGRRRLDLLRVREMRLLPPGRGEPLRPVPGDRPRRPRRLCRADDRARGVCSSHPRCLHRRGGRPAPVRGAIGYRSLRLTGLQDGQNLGLTGFGASAHLVLKMVRHRYPHSRVFVFARTEAERAFARELGATWAGDTVERSPERLHAIIDTTPVWTPIVEALENLEPGGRLVINAIRKEDSDKDALLGLDYPDSPLAREGDQERRQRHAGRRPRIPATGRRDPAQARGPGIRPGGRQPGARRAEGKGHPRGQGLADRLMTLAWPRCTAGLDQSAFRSRGSASHDVGSA